MEVAKSFLVRKYTEKGASKCSGTRPQESGEDGSGHNRKPLRLGLDPPAGEPLRDLLFHLISKSVVNEGMAFVGDESHLYATYNVGVDRHGLIIGPGQFKL